MLRLFVCVLKDKMEVEFCLFLFSELLRLYGTEKYLLYKVENEYFNTDINLEETTEHLTIRLLLNELKDI